MNSINWTIYLISTYATYPADCCPFSENTRNSKTRGEIIFSSRAY